MDCVILRGQEERSVDIGGALSVSLCEIIHSTPLGTLLRPSGHLEEPRRWGPSTHACVCVRVHVGGGVVQVQQLSCGGQSGRMRCGIMGHGGAQT